VLASLFLFTYRIIYINVSDKTRDHVKESLFYTFSFPHGKLKKRFLYTFYA
jgi:hypothetical protein